MNILLFGSTTRGTLAWYAVRALRANGNTVTIINEGRPGTDTIARKLWRHTVERHQLNRSIRATARQEQTDLFLNIGWNKYVSPHTLEKLSSMDVTTANWFPDDLYRFPAMAERGSNYDHFYIIGDYPDKDLRQWGIQDNSSFLTFGYDPDIHTPDKPAEKYQADIGFIGTYTEDRGRVMKRAIDAFPDKTIKIIGNDWQHAPEPVQNHVVSEAVYAEEYVNALNSFDIAINMHQPFLSPNGGPNMRLFETAACGTFCLHDPKPEMERLFSLEDEILVYEDEDQLLDRIAYYLNEPEEREAVAQRARTRVVDDHAYTKRMKTVVDSL